MLFGLTACSTSDDYERQGFEDFSVKTYGTEKPDDVTPTEAWTSQDDPTLFDDDLVFNVDELPLTGEASPVSGSSSTLKTRSSSKSVGSSWLVHASVGVTSSGFSVP